MAPIYRVPCLFVATQGVALLEIDAEIAHLSATYTLRKTDNGWQTVTVAAHGPDTPIRFGDEFGRLDSHGRVYDRGLQCRSRYGTPPYMKAIRVTFDEALLDRLNHSSEAQERGRSAILREAVADYLKRKDAEDITRRYQVGYRDTAKLNDELEGWGGEGAWPKC